jgi:pimeloyl-ACP methyl ester carboxylesterase
MSLLGAPRLSVVALALAASAAGGGDGSPARHLIYLHGRIVQEQQSPRPRHPEYGHYELEAILRTFRDEGFTVDGEIRPRAASVSDSADKVVAKVRALLARGVAADRINVLGASMGAAIALTASARLQEPKVRFAVLGPCLSAQVPAFLASEGKRPSGRILAIRETSDDIGPCAPWKGDPEAESQLVAREIVLDTGLKHGFLYRPLPEWADPVVEWLERPW